eukprot:CAMPEP_0119514064 /NCGR_PEP_ID=MMETSP1344-20130328/31983_1 /TAXON_ID=236787 /ORGANISM="Florenciella parvula, Strain CCMP2471" /LENGTH=94 /DNA_ID=CAMNT_0007551339 /DNA_START=277 /DNA_END=558 /DNA_ORIENTATION=+
MRLPLKSRPLPVAHAQIAAQVVFSPLPTVRPHGAGLQLTSPFFIVIIWPQSVASPVPPTTPHRFGPSLIAVAPATETGSSAMSVHALVARSNWL